MLLTYIHTASSLTVSVVTGCQMTDEWREKIVSETWSLNRTALLRRRSVWVVSA